MIAKKSSQLSFSIATFIFIYLLSNSLLMKGFKYFALRASKVGLISSIRLDGRKTSNLKSLLNFLLRAFKFSFGWSINLQASRCIVSSPLKLGGGGFSFLKFGQIGGSWKNCSEIGGSLGKRGFPNCFISFYSEKHVFITIGFFCLVNIHTCSQ